MTNELLALQRLQFNDVAAAEERLLRFLAGSGLADLVRVELRPKPESLNSLNGFLYFNSGERLFFKTHTEENERLQEYYRAGILQEAGYPVVTPEVVRTVPGQQIAIYKVISFPTLFDLVKSEEDELLRGRDLSEQGAVLVAAQRSLDRTIFSLYAKTLESEGRSTADAPVHQLFAGRLMPGGRVTSFYQGQQLPSPGGELATDELFRRRWRVNGVTYRESLGELVERARLLLDPQLVTPTVVGHGDAHNGNVFWDAEGKQLLYFDPAFAGRHSPLLDLVKPLFHNCLARWMYFPEQVAREFELEVRTAGDVVEINHSFTPSSLRRAFWESKCAGVLEPTVALLRERGCLPANWQLFVRTALLCCPLLTVNLAASPSGDGSLASRYPWHVKLLGLSLAVEMGATAIEGTNLMAEMVQAIS